MGELLIGGAFRSRAVAAFSFVVVHGAAPLFDGCMLKAEMLGSKQLMLIDRNVNFIGAQCLFVDGGNDMNDVSIIGSYQRKIQEPAGVSRWVGVNATS